jgi:hypothetical protein
VIVVGTMRRGSAGVDVVDGSGLREFSNQASRDDRVMVYQGCAELHSQQPGKHNCAHDYRHT